MSKVLPACLMSLIAVIAGCGMRPQGLAIREWTEDVLLDDGSTIEVYRFVAADQTRSLGGDGGNTVEIASTIGFTSKIGFTGTKFPPPLYDRLPPWSEPLIALVMYYDKVTKEWVVVATSSSCEVWHQRGKPNPFYWEFRLGPITMPDKEIDPVGRYVSATGWREVPLSPSSIGRKPNLFYEYQEKLNKNYITVSEREKFQSLSLHPNLAEKYRSIVSRQESINCER